MLQRVTPRNRRLPPHLAGRPTSETRGNMAPSEHKLSNVIFAPQFINRSSVNGFLLPIEVKEGVLIHGKPRNAAKDAPSRPMTVGNYFNAVIVNNGTNPDWPTDPSAANENGQQTWRIPLTTLLKPHSQMPFVYKGQYALAPESTFLRTTLCQTEKRLDQLRVELQLVLDVFYYLKGMEGCDEEQHLAIPILQNVIRRVQ